MRIVRTKGTLPRKATQLTFSDRAGGPPGLNGGIQVALRPAVEITAYEAGDCGNCSGEQEHTEMVLHFSEQTVALTVSVGELRSLLSSENPADTIPMTVERRKYFTDAGISEADVMAILANDPLWNQGAQATPNLYRFVRIPTVLDYAPAPNNTNPDPTPFGLSTNQTNTMTENATHSYSTTVKFAGNASFKTWLNMSLTEKQEETWTWTNSRASSQSTSTTNDANLSLGRPDVGYTGGTAVALYLDTIWKTFAFVIQ